MTRRMLLIALVLAACKSGGQYVTNDRGGGGDNDRGETNGRQLDFVSNKPDGGEWDIRVRGSSFSVGYAEAEDEPKQLKTVNLDNMETQKVWRLIDELDLPSRKPGKKDEDSGFVTLQLREPGGEDQADVFKVFISRDDEEIDELARYLAKLIKRYHKLDADF